MEAVEASGQDRQTIVLVGQLPTKLIYRE
jgi:hypothetical protein